MNLKISGIILSTYENRIKIQESIITILLIRCLIKNNIQETMKVTRNSIALDLALYWIIEVLI